MVEENQGGRPATLIRPDAAYSGAWAEAVDRLMARDALVLSLAAGVGSLLAAAAQMPTSYFGLCVPPFLLCLVMLIAHHDILIGRLNEYLRTFCGPPELDLWHNEELGWTTGIGLALMTMPLLFCMVGWTYLALCFAPPDGSLLMTVGRAIAWPTTSVAAAVAVLGRTRQFLANSRKIEAVTRIDCSASYLAAWNEAKKRVVARDTIVAVYVAGLVSITSAAKRSNQTTLLYFVPYLIFLAGTLIAHHDAIIGRLNVYLRQFSSDKHVPWSRRALRFSTLIGLWLVTAPVLAVSVASGLFALVKAPRIDPISEGLAILAFVMGIGGLAGGRIEQLRAAHSKPGSNPHGR